MINRPTEELTHMWDWPTLSPWDIRVVVWIFTYRFRAQKLDSLAHRMVAAAASREAREQTRVNYLDTQAFAVQEHLRKNKQIIPDIDGDMLDTYFGQLRKAVWIALALRLSLWTLLTTLLFRRYYRKRLARL